MARVTYETFLLIITFLVIFGFDTSSAGLQWCYMNENPGRKAFDWQYTEFQPGASLSDCKTLCLASSTCQATELRGGSCFITNSLIQLIIDPAYTIAVKICSKPQAPPTIITPEPTKTPEPPSNKPCPGKFFNLIFVIDSSNSIGKKLYPENFKFVKSFLSSFEIGDLKTKVALITFGSHPRLIFNNTGDETLINQHLENIPEYQKSTTQTGKALRFVVANGLAGEPRPDVDTIVYLVTDGKSDNYTDTIDAARLVKSQGFAIVAIGVGDKKINWKELQEVATKPEYVIKIDNYEVLKNYAESISRETCNTNNEVISERS